MKRFLEFFTPKTEEIVNKEDPNYYAEGNWYQGFEPDGTLVLFKLDKNIDGKHWEGWEPAIFKGFNHSTWIDNKKVLMCERMDDDKSSHLEEKLKKFIETEGDRLAQTRKRAEKKLEELLS